MSNAPPTQPVTPCEGCAQPRETKSSCFTVSNVKALEKNSDWGCPTCPLILRGLRECLGKGVVSASERLLFVLNGAGVWDFHVVVDNNNDRVVSFFVSPGTHKICPDVKNWPVGYEVPDATSSPASLNWAKANLSHCLASHSVCATSPTATLPDRVLDLGDSPDGGIRLKETSDEHGRYLCLSHRWGTQPFTCTLRSNISIHRHRIPLGDLPLTFRDAVHFTRLLGVRYLWIDSLCIVQDDDEDWRLQAAKMAGIYANALLTVAATHSAGAHQGLFSSPRPETRAHRLAAPHPTNGRDEPGIYARRALSHVDTRYVGSLAASSPPAKDLPLLKRAWPFQERFLSRRVLYFTSSELAWQCTALTACQCRGNQSDASLADLPADTGSKIINSRGYYDASALSAALQTKGKDEVARRWLSLVGDYSTLDLTFERDVLPALSGFAKVFGGFLDTRYVAGLWEGFILTGLLWHPADSEMKMWGDRPREWRAPSWSWASAKTVLSFPSVEELVHPCEVISVDCSLRGPDPAGELARGEMVVRGLVYPARVKYRAVSGERHSWNVYVLDFMERGILGNSYADYDWTVDGPEEVEDGAAVLCLLVGVHAERGNCYLMVLRGAGGQDGTVRNAFERIGLVEIFGHRVRKVSPEGTLHMVLPYEFIEERSGEETITLV